MSLAGRFLAGATRAAEASRFGAPRSRASTVLPAPVSEGRDYHLSASEGGSWAFRPFALGDWETNSSEIVRAMNLAQRLYQDSAIYRGMLRLPASYITGPGRVQFKAVDPAVQELLDDAVENQANSLLRTPRIDYIQWRMYGMAPYLVETTQAGRLEANWQDPRLFAGATFFNRNKALMDYIKLHDTVPFVEGVVELRARLGGGDPVRVIRQQTPAGQCCYVKGAFGVHRVLRRRRLPDSSRNAFDMALLGPMRPPSTQPWPQLVDGDALVLLSNTEGVSLGTPDHIATFDDITRYRASWNAEIERVRTLKDVPIKFFHRGQPEGDLLKLKNEGWRPDFTKAMFLQFQQSPGDMQDIELVNPDIGAYQTSNHFSMFRQEILTDALIPQTWFSAPEQRVLAALAQETPATTNMRGAQGEWMEGVRRFGEAIIDTGRMWGLIPLTASPEFEQVVEPLRKEDASAHVDRLVKWSTFVGSLAQSGSLAPALRLLLIREALAKEDVIDVERYMRTLGATVDDPIPAVQPVAAGLFGPAPTAPQSIKDTGITLTDETLLRKLNDLAHRDPAAMEALAAATLRTPDAQGHATHATHAGNGRKKRQPVGA